jgi:hypothetical protein
VRPALAVDGFMADPVLSIVIASKAKQSSSLAWGNVQQFYFAFDNDCGA